MVGLRAGETRSEFASDDGDNVEQPSSTNKGNGAQQRLAQQRRVMWGRIKMLMLLAPLMTTCDCRGEEQVQKVSATRYNRVKDV